MSFDWQQATALAAVIAASSYLARRAWLALSRKRSGCGACGSCPSATSAEKTVVLLELPHQPRGASPRLSSEAAGR